MSFKDLLINQIEEFPIEIGIIFILVGLGLLVYRVDKKESFIMKDHSLSSWGTMVYSCGLLIICFMIGVTLILNNI